LKNVLVETIFFLMCRISSSSLSFSLSLSLWNQVEMEQERDQLALELDRVHAHGIDQTRSWRDMVAARDRQIVRLEDQLSKIAGSGDEAKRAAAQVLVRKLHEMRRNEEERVLAEATASMASTSNTMNDTGGSSSTGSTGSLSNTQQDVMQARIVALQNEIRQMREEGGVSLVVASRQAARAAEIATASMTMTVKRMERHMKGEEASP
jgi:hypothetical protein